MQRFLQDPGLLSKACGFAKDTGITLLSELETHIRSTDSQVPALPLYDLIYRCPGSLCFSASWQRLGAFL